MNSPDSKPRRSVFEVPQRPVAMFSDVLCPEPLFLQLGFRSGHRLYPCDFNVFNLGIREEVVVNALGRCAPRTSDIVLEDPIASACSLPVFEDFSRSRIAKRIDNRTLSAAREMREAERF